MNVVERQFDFREAAGSRIEFIAKVVPLFDCRAHGVYIMDFMDAPGDYYDDQLVSRECEMLYDEICSAIRRAEAYAAIQTSPERFERVYQQHIKGMRPLLLELKRKLQDCGIEFAKTGAKA